MPRLDAIVFDLGGTLLEFANWDEEMALRWRSTYRNLSRMECGDLPTEDEFTSAMVAAELLHWQRVDTERWSGPPSGLVRDAFRSMGRPLDEQLIVAVLDACALALDGWARLYPDAVSTLRLLRERGLRIGLLSNTWWAAEWHNADLATHGLRPLLDELVYTSDLPHSKPHPVAFQTIAGRLGIPVEACLMVGDRPVDDIGGALSAGMRAVLKTNGQAVAVPAAVHPTAIIEHLAELPAVLDRLT